MNENFKIPHTLFINPWERLIGPNRYLVEMLQYAPDVARKSTIVLNKNSGAAEEFMKLGCKVCLWDEISQISARLSVKNILTLMYQHSFGLRRVILAAIDSKPDLIVSNGEQLLLGDMVAKILGIPHIKIFHTITFQYRLQGLRILINAYLKFFTLGSDVIIAVSDTLKRTMIAGGLLDTNIITVPNPIPIKSLQADSLKRLPESLWHQIKNKGPILVNVGRISPLKGQDQLIETLPIIKKKYPNMLCIFVGKLGSDAGCEDTNAFYCSIKNRIQEQGLIDNVLFIGEIDYLPSLMHNTDLYVHTSKMESFCRAATEALVCGISVVAFDSGAISEVTGPGAMLVKSGDSGALGAAIIDILHHKGKKDLFVEKGRQHIQKYYDAEIVSSKFVDVLIQQLRTKHRAKVCKCVA